MNNKDIDIERELPKAILNGISFGKQIVWYI